ncbi:MAG TPA: hypothetical protein PKL31_03785 [Fulvivirga sp.]|nr:hypothetical protein [Fulvivirga sp.]
MKKIIILSIAICLLHFSETVGQSQLHELLNHVVGGTWISQNQQNPGNPDDFKLFYMRFTNWGDKESVQGNIYGVKNNGDSVLLIQIWNFINKAEKNIYLVQRTTWGEMSTGSITAYGENDLDIQFKSITSQGQQYYTRDLHYLDGNDKMRAETFQKSKEADEWKKTGESDWERIKY